MAAAMEFGLLGPMVVCRDGVPLAVTRGRQQALLAGLLLNAGRIVQVAELTEVLWGPAPPRWALSSLQNYVMHLRRSLADADRCLITTEPDGYQIHLRRGELDVHNFQALLADARAAARDRAWREASVLHRRALSLWRGQPLSGIPSDVLVLREIPQLAEMRLQALEGQLHADLHLGRHAEAIVELDRLAATYPLRERFHALLMTALYQDGQQARALAVYQAVRRELVRELGVEPGHDLRRLQQQILSGASAEAVLDGATGADHATAVPLLGRQRPEVPVPRQLPSPPSTFTGRATELAVLDELAPPATPDMPLCAITGTAGVGKTALAVHWAHKVADLFPDGQLYVNLRGYDTGPPVAATDALARFLRALGVPDQDIPAEPDERAAQYRSLLAGRRMLVLLDNAGAADQVRPLLPVGAACVTVVTSRDALAGLVARDGAVRLELDLLPPADATSLLRALIGSRVAAEPSATQVLAAQCCRLPLALRVAAELAAARPVTSLAALTEELADQQQRLKLLDAGGDADTAVRAVFSWSCRNLNPDAVRMFRLAGLHPGSRLDRFAAAALGGVTVADADDLVRVLVRASLLQPVAPDQYGMHDLLRAYASELADAEDKPDVRRDAVNRLLDHYVYTAATAMDVLYPAERHRRPAVGVGLAADGPPMADAMQARAWLDERLDTLVAVVVHADRQGWSGHATRLAAIVGRYLHTRGHYVEAITVHSCAAHAAQTASDHAAEAESLTSLGAVMVRQGRYRQAAVYLRQALALFRRTGDHAGQAHVLRNLGIVAFRQGNYLEAADHIEQALALFRETGDRTGEASALGNLGGVDLRQGRYREAGDHIRQSLAIYREIGDLRGEAYTLANLGSVDFEQGRFRNAATQLRQSLALCREIGYREGEATALAGLGDVDRGQGRYPRAIGHYRQALAVFQETGNRSGEAAMLNDLGKTLCADGQPEQARIQHDAALTLATRIGDRYEQARAHDGLGQADAAARRLGRARNHWRQALSLYTSFGAPEAEHVLACLRDSVARRMMPAPPVSDEVVT